MKESDEIIIIDVNEDLTNPNSDVNQNIKLHLQKYAQNIEPDINLKEVFNVLKVKRDVFSKSQKISLMKQLFKLNQILNKKDCYIKDAEILQNKCINIFKSFKSSNVFIDHVFLNSAYLSKENIEDYTLNILTGSRIDLLENLSEIVVKDQNAFQNTISIFLNIWIRSSGNEKCHNLLLEFIKLTKMKCSENEINFIYLFPTNIHKLVFWLTISEAALFSDQVRHIINESIEDGSCTYEDVASILLLFPNYISEIKMFSDVIPEPIDI